MNAKQRWMLWGSLLLATVVAAIYPTEPAGSAAAEVASERRPPKAAAQPAVSAPVVAKSADVAPLARDDLPELAGDPFAPVSWEAPPKPAVVPSVAPPPQPVGPVEPQEPPMPYRFLGRMQEEGGQTVIYLARGQDSLVAHAGEALDSQYKLVSVEARKLVIEYLPLGRQHELSIEAP
ncbi:hypothetical protein [Chitinimonas sp.]|uniref:hypothetical protein n=1 Tax=Chitinimonas sp. TaxID=1934313 RepID=UPI0035B37C19